MFSAVLCVTITPVNYSDPTGHFLGAICGAIIGGVGGFIGGAINAAIKGEDIWAGATSGAIGGAIGGAIAGAIVDVFVVPGSSIVTAMLVGAAAGAVGGAVSSTISQPTNHLLNHGSMNGFKMDWEAVAASSFTGAVFNGVGTGFAQAPGINYGDATLKTVASNLWSVGNQINDITYNSIVTAISVQKQTTILPHPVYGYGYPYPSCSTLGSHLESRGICPG